MTGCGTIDLTDVGYIEFMNKKIQVLKVHTRKISQGGGADKRWFTRVDQDGTLKKIVAPTEKRLYEKLYEIYFSESLLSLSDIYPEWLQYKYKVSNRPNNVHRISTDFTRFYQDEPLSQELISKPLVHITPYDIKLWGSQLIKKYKFTKKQFGNVMVPLRQCIDLMVDKGLMATNPARIVRFDQGLFAPARVKPDAGTQIFFPDELELVLKTANIRASETNDEMYLAIPIYIYTGVRPGECLALKFSDFDSATNTVNITRSLAVKETLSEDGTWSGRHYEVQEYLKKNAKPRVIVVPDTIFDTLKQIKRILESKNITREYLFQPKSPNNIERKLYRICDSLNITRRSLNKLRKTYVSRLLNEQFDVDFVRRQAGHTTIQTTLNNYTFQTTRNEALIGKLNGVVPNCTSK